MAALPSPQHSTARRIYRMHEERRAAEPEGRPYLGASELGDECERKLWLAWRWCANGDAPAFDGRMLRLFEAGNIFEARIIAELRAIGCTVEGEQHEVSFADGHGAGHLDGVVLGLEEAPKTWHCLEAKTHNAKSFADLKAKGVEDSKPKHFSQVQIYMGLAGLTRAVYIAENKDTSELYVERVEFDKRSFDALMERARRIVAAAEPPVRISADGAFWLCRMCSFAPQCHGEIPPAATCRSCAHSTPAAAGAWRCEHYGAEIPDDAQRAGCDEHRFIPALVERLAELVEATPEGRVRWRNKLTGRSFDQPGYTSAELSKCRDWRVVGDDFVEEVKAVFGAASRVRSTAPTEVGDAPASDLALFYEDAAAVAAEAWPAGRE